MGKINAARWILCGVIAGIVGDLVGSLVDGVLLAPRWNAGLLGLATWIPAFLLPNTSFMYITPLYSHHLTLYTTLGSLVGCLLAALAGAALYKEA